MKVPRAKGDPTPADSPRERSDQQSPAHHAAPEESGYGVRPGEAAYREDQGGGEQPPAAPLRRGPSHWGRARRASYLLLVVIIATPLFAAFRVWYVARQDNRTHSDAIIVLGAAQFNGRPSAVLESRLLHALILYQEGVAPRIVTVGGNKPGDNYTEAGTGSHWLSHHGVPLRALDAVPAGSNTRQSMVAVGKEFKRQEWRSAVIVTGPWHGLRSATMARDNGINAVTSPTRSGPIVSGRETEFRYIVRETEPFSVTAGDGL